MRRKYHCHLFVNFLFCVLFSTTCMASPEPKPLIVLLERPGWDRTPEQDTPEFVLYDNGLVIVKKSQKSLPLNFLSEELSSKDFQILKNSYLNPSLFRIKSSYKLSRRTDNHSTYLYLWDGKKEKIIWIYGYYPGQPASENCDPSLLPHVLGTVLNQMINFDTKKEKVWFPKKVEIFIRGEQNPGNRLISWDKSWPDINSSHKQKIEGGFELIFNQSQWKSLETFLIPLENRNWTLLNGKSWKISYHIPFPGEENWN